MLDNICVYTTDLVRKTTGHRMYEQCFVQVPPNFDFKKT